MRTHVNSKSRWDELLNHIKFQYNNPSLCDVKINIYQSLSDKQDIEIDGQSTSLLLQPPKPVQCYYLHRIIVSQSRVFKKMLDNDSSWIESKKGQVDFTCYDGEFITKDVLDLFFKLFYYVDDAAMEKYIDDIQTHCIALHYLANMVEYDSMKREIENIISKNMMDKKNIVQLVDYCVKNSDSTQEIRRECIQWLKIYMYTRYIVTDELLMAMDYDMFKKIVTANDLFTIDNNRSLSIEQFIGIAECVSKCTSEQLNELKNLALQYSAIKSVTHRRIDNSLKSVLAKCDIQDMDQKQIESMRKIKIHNDRVSKCEFNNNNNNNNSNSSSSSSSSELDSDTASRKQRNRKRVMKNDDGGHHSTYNLNSDTEFIKNIDKPFHSKFIPSASLGSNPACTHKVIYMTYMTNDSNIINEHHDKSKPTCIHKFDLLDCSWELYIHRDPSEPKNSVTFTLSVEDSDSQTNKSDSSPPPSSFNVHKRHKTSTSSFLNHKYKPVTKMISCECDIEMIVIGRKESLTFNKQVLQMTANGCRRTLFTIPTNFDEDNYFMQEFKESFESETPEIIGRDGKNSGDEEFYITKLAAVPIIMNISVRSLRVAAQFKKIPIVSHNSRIVIRDNNKNTKKNPRSIVLVPPSHPPTKNDIGITNSNNYRFTVNDLRTASL
jgi:hypothetical protein